MGFKNYDLMVEQLRLQEYTDGHAKEFISSLIGQHVFTTAQENEIVRLFNLHCMPAKFESSEIRRNKRNSKYK